MTLTEKQMEDILKQDIEISDVVNERINDTYKMLLTEQKNKQKSTRKGKRSYIAAAAAIACCLIIPTAVYAAANTDFFDVMFGNTTRKSTPAITKEIDNQKGGTTSVTFPSHEYVPVDPEEAKQLVGSGAMSEPVERQLGDHTLRIENLVYDKNSAFMHFTLEREGGVTMLIGNEELNEAKGAYIADDSLWTFDLETTEGTPFFGHINVDMEKSTEDKFYCSAYLLSLNKLKDGELPVLKIYKYPVPRAEILEDLDESELHVEEVPLTEKEAIPVQKVDMGENGYFEYSPLSLAVDLSRGTGISEEDAVDPYCLYHLEIRYKDGTSYVIRDNEDNIDNTSYAVGVETLFKVAYNRIVDFNEVKEIIVNDTAFSVE